MARAGNYRHKFYLQEGQNTNVYGENSVVWRRETEFWGSIHGLKGVEYFGNDKLRSSMTHKIRTRYLTGVNFTPNKRVVMAASSDRIFNIQNVSNVDERNFTVEMMVQEDGSTS